MVINESAAKRAGRGRRRVEKVFYFKVGTVVWAKLEADPYWPATVSELPANDEIDKETRVALQKEYENLPTSGSTSPAVVLVKWFGMENSHWDWVDTNKLSGAQEQTNRAFCHFPGHCPPLPTLSFSVLRDAARACVCVCMCALLYAAWNSPFSKAPDQQSPMSTVKISKGDAPQYQLALVEAAVHFTKTSLDAV